MGKSGEDGFLRGLHRDGMNLVIIPRGNMLDGE